MGLKSLLSIGILLGLGIVVQLSNNYAGYTGIIPETLRLIFGAIGLLFLPGYWITQAIFNESEIDTLEMLALSFAFSISTVPLLVFYINKAGFIISARLIYAICSAVCIGGIILSQGKHSHNTTNN